MNAGDMRDRGGGGQVPSLWASAFYLYSGGSVLDGL